VAPIFKKYFKKFLDGKKHKVQAEVDETLTLLPYLRKVTKLAWQEIKKNEDLISFAISWEIQSCIVSISK